MAVVSNAVNTASVDDRNRTWDAMYAYYGSGYPDIWGGYESMNVAQKLAAYKDEMAGA